LTNAIDGLNDGSHIVVELFLGALVRHRNHKTSVIVINANSIQIQSGVSSVITSVAIALSAYLTSHQYHGQQCHENVYLTHVYHHFIYSSGLTPSSAKGAA
jgi:hypothetical protein